ncbi:MAG TPA: protease inhibitor Inh/omp19 family protein [Pararhizobium sp.]|nr:protease inhibitor Inh/omp19 family protein [Pararhizobium sp.]
MRISQAGLVLAVAVALTGCERTAYRTELPSPSQPAPLTPAPVGGVEQSQLPPPGANSQFPAAPGESAPGTQQQANLGSANGPEIKRESLIGRWTVTSGGSSCDLFLALTKWTGGYRAASRNCANITANVSAWDVKGNQVVLSDNIGNQIASLSQTGNEQYSGSTAAGQPITLTR